MVLMNKSTIVIRLAAAADAGAIADIYAPFVAADATSFETEPRSAEGMGRGITETTVNYPWLVCDRDGVVTGYAYATRHRARAAYQWCDAITIAHQPWVVDRRLRDTAAHL